MGKTKPGVERLAKQDLQRQKRFLGMFIDEHESDCVRCHNAGRDVYAKCSKWWRAARDLHSVNRKLKRYDTPDTDGMTMLPGMDEL